MQVFNWKRKLAVALASIGWLSPNVCLCAPLDVNLVRNASFEDVDDFFPGPFTSLFIEEWTDHDGDEDDTFAYPYFSAYSGFPEPPGAEDFHFTGGFNTVPGDVLLSQVVDVSGSPSGDLIASGNAFFNLSAFFSTYREQQEASLVRVRFLDTASSQLGSAEVGGLDFLVSLPITEGQREWGQSVSGGSVPVGTATVEVQVVSEGGAVNYDGYLDLVDFQIGESVRLKSLDVEITRETGEITLSNQTGGPVDISGYSLISPVDALDPNSWLSIADNYDADSGGSVDPDSNWTEISATAALLNETRSTGQATLENRQTVALGVGTWIANATEELVFQYLSNGETIDGIVTFGGNDGESFGLADLNTDGKLDADDWMIFRDAHHVDLSGLSPVAASLRGDLNGDMENNHTDFVLFEQLYDQANGPGALAALVPEPSSLILILSSGLFFSAFGRSRNREDD